MAVLANLSTRPSTITGEHFPFRSAAHGALHRSYPSEAAINRLVNLPADLAKGGR